MNSRKFSPVSCLLAAALSLGAVGAAPTAAYGQGYSLFDKFNVGVGISALSFDTRIRVDAANLGTEIDYESTLGVSSDELTPSLHFEWNPGRRHSIFGRWDATERDGTEQVSTELEFGDLVIPINATVTTAFDLDEVLLGYTYFPWLRERWALGFGLGFRMLDITTAVEIKVLPGGGPGLGTREGAEVDGPLPFLGIDYRYAMTPAWRFGAKLGLFDLELGDYEGSQTVLSSNVEHLPWENFSWGFGLGLSTVDVDVTASAYKGSAKIDILRGGLFAKARW